MYQPGTVGEYDGYMQVSLRKMYVTDTVWMNDKLWCVLWVTHKWRVTVDLKDLGVCDSWQIAQYDTALDAVWNLKAMGFFSAIDIDWQLNSCFRTFYFQFQVQRLFVWYRNGMKVEVEKVFWSWRCQGRMIFFMKKSMRILYSIRVAVAKIARTMDSW